MDISEKIRLVKEVGEEIIEERELYDLFSRKKNLVAYDGFEPSGRIHIAQGLLRAINVNKLTKAGIIFKFWVADWFALMNNKLGGDLGKIQDVGEYFIEVWKASGMNMKNVRFLWASEHMNQEYWLRTVQIARMNTVQRITRCAQIMGRKESEQLSAAQIFYPCMQASDIFQLKVDICQLGMDQRKVNVLAREIAPKLGFKKPIAVHHHMLMGLQPSLNLGGDAVERAIEMKMSKSHPDSAVFMADSKEEVNRKIKKAYCVEGEVENNPLLEYCKYIIFELNKEVKIERERKFGGDMCFESYASLEQAYARKEIHPMDLKEAVARYINNALEPVRNHFKKTKKAAEMEKRVLGYEVTR